jgi:hypothetical protein
MLLSNRVSSSLRERRLGLEIQMNILIRQVTQRFIKRLLVHLSSRMCQGDKVKEMFLGKIRKLPL